LAGATLTGVASGALIGVPASLPTGWRIAKGYLVGARADLRAANLTGAILTSANLTYTNLQGANLSNANLYKARLTGALTDGVTWTGATCPDGAGAARHAGGSCVAALLP